MRPQLTYLAEWEHVVGRGAGYLPDSTRHRSFTFHDWNMSTSDSYVVMEWHSSSAVETSGEPTDYVYEARGDLIYIGEDQERKIVGRFGCYYIDLDRAVNDGMAVADVFDAYAQTNVFCDVIFDVQTEEYSSRIKELFETPPFNRNVLILDRLEILPEFRGRKLGLAVLRHMIQRFGAGVGLVALKAFPLQLEARSTREESDEWQAQLNLSEFKASAKTATRKLVSYYSMLGFARMPGTELMFRSNDDLLPDLTAD